ncbi:unnamed protein product, partial [Ectocarpus sp. 12 AP-2014]
PGAGRGGGVFQGLGGGRVPSPWASSGLAIVLPEQREGPNLHLGGPGSTSYPAPSKSQAGAAAGAVAAAPSKTPSKKTSKTSSAT